MCARPRRAEPRRTRARRVDSLARAVSSPLNLRIRTSRSSAARRRPAAQAWRTTGRMPCRARRRSARPTRVPAHDRDRAERATRRRASSRWLPCESNGRRRKGLRATGKPPENKKRPGAPGRFKQSCDGARLVVTRRDAEAGRAKHADRRGAVRQRDWHAESPEPERRANLGQLGERPVVANLGLGV